MANNILFGNCDKHIIKVRVQELNRGPQGPQGPKGDDGAIQYTAGTGISISDENVISATGTGAAWGAITGVLSNQADLNVALSTKASNDAVQAAQNTANQAVSTANAAQTAATNANAGVADLINYLTLSVFNTYNGSQFTVTSGTGTIDSNTNLYVARNAEGSLAKIYGTLGVSGSTRETRTTVKLNIDTGLRPDSRITIVNSGFVNLLDSYGIANLNLSINPDGTIELEGYHGTENFAYRAMACLLFIKDFGDTPEP